MVYYILEGLVFCHTCENNIYQVQSRQFICGLFNFMYPLPFCRLQQRVAELEEQVTSLENSSSATISVTDCSTSQSQTTDSRSLHESPLSQRCGSAPPAFITSALKYAKNDNQNIGGDCSVDSSRCTGEESKLGSIHQRGTVESRTSSVSMPETNSNFIHKNHFETDRKEAFHRGQSYASTRSLNIGGHLSSGNFVRRKYSTISLRRVRRRNTASKKVGFLNCAKHVEIALMCYIHNMFTLIFTLLYSVMVAMTWNVMKERLVESC